MNYKKYYVAFIDILGYRELSNEFFKTNDNSIIKKIELSIDEAFYLDDLIFKKRESEILFLSDSLMIFLEAKDENYDDIHWLFIFLSYFQSRCLINGVLIRGAISQGLHYAHKKENYSIVVSQALNKSAEFEKNSAIYPRIIIDNDIIESYGDRLKKELFINSEDDSYFIDFYHGLIGWSFYDRENNSQINIDTIMEKVFCFIHEELANTKLLKIKEKYLWLNDYLCWRYNTVEKKKYEVKDYNLRNLKILWDKPKKLRTTES